MSHPCCAWGIGKTEELKVQGFSLQLKKAPESNSSELHFQKEVVQKQTTTLFWFVFQSYEQSKHAGVCIKSCKIQALDTE